MVPFIIAAIARLVLYAEKPLEVMRFFVGKMMVRTIRRISFCLQPSNPIMAARWGDKNPVLVCDFL
jgi:hypothetical protein